MIGPSAEGTNHTSSAALTPTEYRPTAPAPASQPKSSMSWRSTRYPAISPAYVLAEYDTVARAAVLSTPRGATERHAPTASQTDRRIRPSPAITPSSQPVRSVTGNRRTARITVVHVTPGTTAIGL